MKVQNDVSIFVGNSKALDEQIKVGGKQRDKKSIYAGELNPMFDPVAKKRQEARQQAMKIVGEAWGADKKLDDDVQLRRDKIAAYKEEMGQANKELKWFGDERAKLQEAYGISDDSQEQQDLKLLEKQMDAKRGQASLTKEDSERLAQIEAAGLTEYQEHSMALYEESRYYDDMRLAAQAGITQESQAIESIQLNRLKSQGMIKATQNAEEVMKAASDEIISMLTEEAKDHIDEEMEEKVEKAEEAEEKKEEQEEKLEKVKEKKEAQEEFTEQISEATEYMVDLDSTMEDVQKEIKKIMDEMKLLEEDMKGAAVDTIS